MYTCVMTHVDSSLTDLYTGYWSPSHDNLCHFKVSVLVSLEWGHQTLSCFWFLTYPHTSRVCSCFIMWPKFNHIGSFALDKVHIWGRTYDFWSSEPGWPCSEWCSPIPSIYLQMIRFCSSSWLSKVPLCTSITFFLIHSSIEGHQTRDW
jgi:hypothetical protein